MIKKIKGKIDMKKLKSKILTDANENSRQYIQDVLDYNGYSDSTQFINFDIIKCEEVPSKKAIKAKTIGIELERMRIPENMSLVDAIRTISYVLNQTSKKINQPKNTSITTQITNMCLPQYGFKQDLNKPKKTDSCCTLYVVEGNPLIFKTTKFYNDYFDWYCDVKKDEIQTLYKKAGLPFPKTTIIDLETEIDDEPSAE